MNSCKKTISTCLLAAFGFIFAFPISADASSIGELQGKKDKLASEIQSKKNSREATRVQKDENEKALNFIKNDIEKTKARIDELNVELELSQERIDLKTAEIREKEKEFDKRKNILDSRLVDIYKNGDPSILDVLFESQSFSDFLTRFEYMSYIADKDQELLKEIKEMKEALENEKISLEIEKNRYYSLKSEQEARQNGLQSQEAEKEKMVADLAAEEQALSNEIAEMSAASEAIGNQIAEIQRREAEEAAARAAAAMAQGSIAAGQMPMATVNMSSTVSTSGYLWPVPSSTRITSPYGARSNPFTGGYDFHMGTDIAAPMGTPTISSRPGKIIIQVFHPSYGNYVVVDHGDGISTVYAHLSGFACAPGAIVEAGQVIGFIGSTGSSTGAHLHFEVRINGQHTNPMAFIG